jgi:hypothetical protein
MEDLRAGNQGEMAAPSWKATPAPPGCQHRVEPDPAEMADRYGAEVTLIDWRDRLVCSRCGSHKVDLVMTGT